MEQEEAKAKKEKLLNAHKRRCIEENIQVELTQQRNKQMQLANQARKEALLKKIRYDNIRVLALERYKTSMVTDKSLIQDAINKQRDKIELIYESNDGREGHEDDEEDERDRE